MCSRDFYGDPDNDAEWDPHADAEWRGLLNGSFHLQNPNLNIDSEESRVSLTRAKDDEDDDDDDDDEGEDEDAGLAALIKLRPAASDSLGNDETDEAIAGPLAGSERTGIHLR